MEAQKQAEENSRQQIFKRILPRPLWMKRLAYAKKRDANEAVIVDLLRKSGASVYLTDQPTDALLGFRGETTLAEFKTGKRKLNANQARFVEEWRGSAVVVMRTPEDAIDWINGKAK